eukprot:7217372-Alexandrium_andersonii.AAC.1
MDVAQLVASHAHGPGSSPTKPHSDRGEGNAAAADGSPTKPQPTDPEKPKPITDIVALRTNTYTMLTRDLRKNTAQMTDTLDSAVELMKKSNVSQDSECSA